MRRTLGAAMLVTAVGAVGIVIAMEATRATPVAPVSARVGHRGPPDMPDAAAIASLRAVAQSGVRQAQALSVAVGRCRGRSAPGQCVLVALEHAAAGAKLSGVVLHAVAARLPPGPCMTIAARLAGLASTIAYLGVDGVRDAWWPGYTWDAARAAARVGRRLTAVQRGAWPRRCVGGLRA
jgi:hypothetical protein